MTGLRRLSDERGLTVIELVIVSALLMIIVGAAFSMLDSGTRTERLQQARHAALLDLRESMTRMTKDIRQAVWIDPTSTRARIEMITLIAGEEQSIAYAVVSNPETGELQLVRDFGGGTEVLLADHVTSPEPFCYSYEPLVDADDNEILDDDGNPMMECLDGGGPPQNFASWSKLIRIEVALEPEVFSGGPITLATEIRLRNL